MMKKLLSALTALVLSGAYAASLTVGGQVQSGIKIKGEDGMKLDYYLDPGDTKIFLNYKDEEKGIVGTLIGDFGGTGNALKANQAWIKFDLFKVGNASVYTILGLQPNVVKVCDFSLMGVKGPGNKNFAKVEKAVTVGASLGDIKLQATLANPNNPKGIFSFLEVAATVSTPVVDIAAAFDADAGVLGNENDNAYLVYGYANIKVVEPFKVEAQASFSGGDENVFRVAAKASLKDSIKLISKPIKPYVQFDFATLDAEEFALRAGTIVS